jgi:hypothetical protein
VVQWACQGRLVDLEFLFSYSLLLTPYSAFLHSFDPIPGLLGISQYDVISNKRFMWHHSTHLVLQEALQHCLLALFGRMFSSSPNAVLGGHPGELKSPLRSPYISLKCWVIILKVSTLTRVIDGRRTPSSFVVLSSLRKCGCL